MVKIQKAVEADLEEILALQYLAYQSEALLLNCFDLPPLKQTLEGVAKDYRNGIVLKATDENRIIGSVRMHREGETVYVGKLIVHPQKQGKGIGTQLLSEAEKMCPSKRYELFTSSRSLRNIMLYQKLGYRIFRSEILSEDVTLTYLEKITENI